MRSDPIAQQLACFKRMRLIEARPCAIRVATYLALSAAQQEPSLPQQEPPEVAQELKEKLTMAAAPMRTMTLAIFFIIKDELVHFSKVCNCKPAPLPFAGRNEPGFLGSRMKAGRGIRPTCRRSSMKRVALTGLRVQSVDTKTSLCE